MKLIVEGRDHFELMRNLPKVIRPQDFDLAAISYFTFRALDSTRYQIQKAERSYQDDMLFMEEVSSKLAGREIYGIVSMINEETTLGFRGLHFIAEFVLLDKEWALRWFEDFNIRERSPAERRFEISSDFDNLKKILS